MAKSYIKNNKEKTKDLFQKKVSYKVTMNSTPHHNLVDFNFGEKFMYGRVNRLFEPMILKNERTNTKSLTVTNGREREFKAVNFVVDAFNDMSRQFQKCAYTRKIDTTDPYLTTLKVYKAYQNPSKMYEGYRNGYFSAIAQTFKRNKIKVKDFTEFITHLMPILAKVAGRNPMTRPAYVKSRRCPATCSGLVIEIADLDPVNDQEKINQFVNSNNWDFYVNACASFGFMVDKSVPWRLVADIGSYPTRSPMLDYAAVYGHKSADQIIANTYKVAHLSYFNKFKNDLFELYNTVKLRNFSIITDSCGRTVTKIIIPRTYTQQSFYEEYSDEYFLKLYYNIRIIEEESKFDENKKSIMIDDSIELFQQGGIALSLGAFERILNKPFDYRGSLGYINKQLNAIESEEFRGALDAITISQGY